MTTAFVLSGGGSLGSVQVGMLQALADAGVTPDLLVGTSAGALNAAFAAGHGSGRHAIDALAEVWAGLRGSSVFRFDPRFLLRGGAGSLCSNSTMRSLLARHLDFGRLEWAPIPLLVVATDLLTGDEVVLSEGDAASAVLASCAIPGVFPPVTREGLTLGDGGLANNTAISQAVEAGADHVYVLPCGYPCALPTPPRGVVGALAHALDLLTHQRLISDVAAYRDRVDLIVLTPPCPITVGPADFGHARELITRSRTIAAKQLRSNGGRRDHPERDIATHHHLELQPTPAPTEVALPE